MLIIVSDGGVRKIPTSSETAGAYSTSVTTDTGETYRTTEVFEEATNNQMELLGMLEGVMAAYQYVVQHGPTEVFLVSDSQLVIKGISEGGYLETWRRRNYHKASGQPVVNSDIWRVLDIALIALRQVAKVNCFWVRGHLTPTDIQNITDPHIRIFSQLNVRCDEALGAELDKVHFDTDRYVTKEDKLASHLQTLQQLSMNMTLEREQREYDH